MCESQMGSSLPFTANQSPAFPSVKSLFITDVPSCAFGSEGVAHSTTPSLQLDFCLLIARFPVFIPPYSSLLQV